MKRVVIHTAARRELDEAMTFYERQRPGLGLDLGVAVEDALKTIQRNPKIGAPYKATAFRRVVVRRFPYVLFYLETNDALWIAAIAHGKRRPDYWKRRKTK